MAAAALAAAEAAASKWRNGVFAFLPSYAAAAAGAADPLVGSLMDGYIFVSTNIVCEREREGEGPRRSSSLARSGG